MVLPKSDGPSLPVILWSRLYFDLAPYLTERLVDGSALLNFYHRELGDVSKSVFLADDKDKLFHERLADYFRYKADPAQTNTWEGHSLLGLSELPYHLTQAGLFEQVYQTLTDFKFLEHKAAEVGVLERKDEKGDPVNTYTGVLQLQEDYEHALAAMPGGEGGLDERAPLILTGLETSKGLMVYCPVCNKASPIQKEMLDTVIACPKESCKAPIRLNPFTVKSEVVRVPWSSKARFGSSRRDKGNVMGAFSRALGREAHLLTPHPDLLWQQIYNRLQWEGEDVKQIIAPELTRRSASGAKPWMKTKTYLRESSSLVRTLNGHTSTVRAIAVSPDGKCILSGSEDFTIKAWDLKNGTLLRTYKGHESYVRTLAVTPDGTRIISGSDDCTLRVWDLENGVELLRFTDVMGRIEAVVVTPDNKRAISIDQNCELREWDLFTGKVINKIYEKSGFKEILAITPEGRHIISSFSNPNMASTDHIGASNDCALKIWSLENLKTLTTLKGHTDSVMAIAMTPDGRYAVTGSLDNTIIVWNLMTGELYRTLVGHNAPVFSVAVSPDGYHAISGSSDNTIKIWNLKIDKAPISLEGHAGRINTLVVTPDSRQIISGSSDHTIKIWDVESETNAQYNLRYVPGHSHEIRDVKITSDGQYAISYSFENRIIVWSLKTGKEIHSLYDNKIINAVAISPFGHHAASASRDNAIVLWDLDSGCKLQTLRGQSIEEGLFITHDGRHVVSCPGDDTIKVWDLEKGIELFTLRGHHSKFNTLALTPDGNCIASAGHEIFVWNLENGERLFTLVHEKFAPISSLSVTPNGKRFISVSISSLKLWDLESGTELHSLKVNNVKKIEITPDGKKAISSRSSQLIEWNLVSGEVIQN